MIHAMALIGGLQGAEALVCLVVSGVVVVAMAVGLFLILKISRTQEGRAVPADIFPFACKPAMTPAEQQFYTTLRECLPPDVILMMKVRLADFMNVTMQGKGYMQHFGRISQKHADFLLIDARTFLPVLVIELDDSSHNRRQRTIDSDGLKNQVYAAAKLPLLRVPAARTYDANELCQLIRGNLAQIA